MNTNSDDKPEYPFDDPFPALTDISKSESYLIECFRDGLKDSTGRGEDEDTASFLAGVKNVLAAFEEIAPYYVEDSASVEAILDTLSTAKAALSAKLDGQG